MNPGRYWIIASMAMLVASIPALAQIPGSDLPGREPLPALPQS
jgi:hypothetical protein